MKAALVLALLLATASAAETPPPPKRTIVRDPAALTRLRRNSGITLQWISFETPARGHVTVRPEGGRYRLQGAQAARSGPGLLTVNGVLLSIDRDRFTFQGRIVITGAPDSERRCVRDGTYEFRVTQRRRYWRLQQMEMCDGLTDYVDIYF